MERGAASRFAHRAASGVVVTAIIIPLTVGLVGFPGAFRNWEFWSLTFLAQARVVEARSADVPLEIKFDRNQVTVEMYRSVMDRWGPPRYNPYTRARLGERPFVAAAERISNQINAAPK